MGTLGGKGLRKLKEADKRIFVSFATKLIRNTQ